MSDTLEETSFDYIILGTGLTEFVLAGVGKKVLHLDNNQHYGSNWSTFGIREIARFYSNHKGTRDVEQSDPAKTTYSKQYSSVYRNVNFQLFPTLLSQEEKDDIKSKIAEGLSIDTFISNMHESDKDLFQPFTTEDPYEAICLLTAFNKLLKSSRSYNLDIAPKLLGSREELVEILIRSGVGRYLEFENVGDIYMYDETLKALEKVPGSKEDVFTSKSVSLVDKRKLMKFLTFAMEYKEGETEITESTYGEFLQDKFKISGKLLDAIVYAIALVDMNVPTRVGIEHTHKFVQSMGRFGKGTYLCPLYGGASEIAQAFCRICAVYGGIYILDYPVDQILVNDVTNECTGIKTKTGQEFHCSKLITGMDYLPSIWLPNGGEFGTWISRAIVVTDQPLKDAENKDTLAYSVFPPGSDAGNEDYPIYVIHQSQKTMACPSNQYVTYFWTESANNNALKNALQLLLNEETHCILSMFYDQRRRTAYELEQTSLLPKHIVPCSDPDASLDFQSAISEAMKLFYLCEGSDAQFMPPAEEDPDEYE
ncbi:unnamed protein product [Rhizopus microsporus]